MIRIGFIFLLYAFGSLDSERTGPKLPLIILILIFLIPVIPRAAETTESLVRKLNHVTGREKIKILNRLSCAFGFRKKSLEKCIVFGNQALALARSFNDRAQEAEALLNIGIGYLYSDQKENAQKYISQTLAISKELLDQKHHVGYLDMLGVAYRQTGYPVKSMECFLNALKIFKEIGNSEEIAFVYNRLGAAYWDLSEYDKALTFYLEAERMFKAIGNKSRWANTLNNIGMLYQSLEDTHKALQFYQKSLKIRKEIDTKKEIAASLNNMGIVYTDLNDLTKALAYFQSSLKIREDINDRSGIVKCLGNLGRIYQKLGNNQKTVEKYQKALTLAEAIGDERLLPQNLLGIARFYIATKAYDQAYPYLTRGLKIAEKFKANDIQMNLYGDLSQLYSGKGDYKKALEYHKLHSELKENISSKKTINKSKALEIKYEIEKKEKENLLLMKENQTRRLENWVQIIISIAVILLLIAILIIIYRYYQYYKKEVQRKEERQKILELESKLKLFQARINPHFLFNSLNSIKELGYEYNPLKIEKLVYQLSDMYRQILNISDIIVSPLENEIAIVRDYLEIEKRMIKGLLDYHIDIDKDLLSFQVIPLSIETLVENSVIHGIAPKGKGTVTINIYKKNQSVLIEISDDGVGFDIKKANLGFGLYSIQERLKLYYQDKASFKGYKDMVPGELFLR